jgi:hypothetical protein
MYRKGLLVGKPEGTADGTSVTPIKPPGISDAEVDGRCVGKVGKRVGLLLLVLLAEGRDVGIREEIVGL